MLTHGGDTAEALDLLRAAEATPVARSCGRSRAGYAGCSSSWASRRTRSRSEALASLTAAERRVAALAAEGLTNRQIAEQLLVSVKAVEWHLSNVYRKLEIRSRKGLMPSLGAPA